MVFSKSEILYSQQIKKITFIISSYQYCYYFGSRAIGTRDSQPFLEKIDREKSHLLCYIVCIYACMLNFNNL